MFVQKHVERQLRRQSPYLGLREGVLKFSRQFRAFLVTMPYLSQDFAAVKTWLEARSYKQLPGGDGTRFDAMPPGTFSFRTNVPVKLEGGVQSVNIPIDAVIMPRKSKAGDLPIFFEAKSAGDFTNTNTQLSKDEIDRMVKDAQAHSDEDKRRKEEAVKMAQLRSTYGSKVHFNLFLCGYFDTGYLGYEAAEGIDWIWEHRIDDLTLFGI